jgi:hypothetical protein
LQPLLHLHAFASLQLSYLRALALASPMPLMHTQL